MGNTIDLDLPYRFWKLRAEAAEAECERLRAVIEDLTDELHVRADKIIALDLKLRGLDGNTSI